MKREYLKPLPQRPEPPNTKPEGYGRHEVRNVIIFSVLMAILIVLYALALAGVIGG